METTGVDSAWMIPVGATITSATWHLCEAYGPGMIPHADAMGAIQQGIERAERQEAAYREQQGAGADIWPWIDSGFSIELRWHMKWEQGVPLPSGAPTFSSGIEMPVTRQTYPTVAEAREHLARIEKYAAAR